MGEFDFNAEVDVEIDYDSQVPEGFEYESRNSNAKIKYRLNLEMREWGVKNFIFTMPTQELSLSIDLMSQESEDYESFTFNLKLEDMDIESPEDLGSGDIAPSTLTLTISDLVKIDDSTYEAKATGTLSF